MRETIRVRGTRVHVEQLTTAIRDSQVQGVEVSAPVVTNGNLLNRTPLGQFGLVEILISIAGSMVSSAAYDGIKRIIDSFTRDGKVEVVATDPKTQSKHAQKSNRGHTKKKPVKSAAPKKRPQK